MLPALLIITASLLAYTWLVYPLVMWRVARRRQDTTWPAAGPPGVVVVFSAHNEESVIVERLENLAALDYPPNRLRVCVGVDGGTDATAALAREWAATHDHVEVTVSEQNRGKTAMLKQLVQSTISHPPSTLNPQPSPIPPSLAPPSILVFTDANTHFAPDTLRRLTAPFADPRVGGVCGRLVFRRRADGATQEEGYWSIETRLKTAESRLDSCLGANGAIYAMRMDCFWPDLPDNTIVDDFVIGMKVREQGWRFVYEPRACAWEDLPVRVEQEWTRRVRIGAGSFQALGLCRRCLTPRYGRFAWAFWSHKVLRWFTPHLMLVGLAAAAAWAVSGGTAAHALPVAAAVAVLGCGLIGRLGVRAPSRLFKPFQLLYYFLAMQAALFAGFLRYCRGGLTGRWERTERGT
jgi:cellulose synthase/poly-beta-1,6-N-acetylglucosamine synthase-like glycosyltransferase